jgi:hypothetical protein
MNIRTSRGSAAPRDSCKARTFTASCAAVVYATIHDASRSVAGFLLLGAFGCGGSIVAASADAGASSMGDATVVGEGGPPEAGGGYSPPPDAEAGADIDAGFAVCPPGIDATFSSILTKMLATSGCGTDRVLNCHSASGAAPSGTGNLLDFAADAATVYTELLGPDGGGRWAVNLAGAAHVKEVVPGDASASFLYIKLVLKTSTDPQYGAGMPMDPPGSVCPAAVDAVKRWIEQGAAAN